MVVVIKCILVPRDDNLLQRFLIFKACSNKQKYQLNNCEHFLPVGFN